MGPFVGDFLDNLQISIIKGKKCVLLGESQNYTYRNVPYI